MKNMRDYLNIRWDKHKKHWDTVLVICGEVGTGKSNLALNILDYWLNLKYGDCKPEHIKHISLTKEDWAKDLSDSNKNEMVVFDEAGEISSRKAMSKFNADLIIAYQIIRADTMFSVLILPDIKYLDTYFRNSRVKHLAYVYERGKFAFFLKDKLKLLMAKNENYPRFNYRLVRPSFYDNFSIYKGPMAEAYAKLKEDKTRAYRRKIKDIISKGSVKNITTLNDIPQSLKTKIEIMLLNRLGHKHTEVSKFLELTPQYVGQIVRETKKEEMKA